MADPFDLTGIAAGEGVAPPSLPVLTPQEAMQKPGGTKFTTVGGDTMQVPYRVSNAQAAARLPEGSEFITPDNQRLKVPETDPLGPVAQMLYSMAPDDYRRKEAIKLIYGPESLITTPAGDLRVKVPGQDKMLNPDKWGPERLIGDVAPVGGAVAGSVGAGALGLASGPGALAAGVVGASVGSGLGQGINDGILAMFGIHPESLGAEAGGVGEAALAGAVGEGAGRVVGRVVPPVYRAGKAFAQTVADNPLEAMKSALPTTIRQLWGTEDAALARAYKLVKGDPERGIPSVRTAPSRVHPEAPYVKFLVEIADSKFRESPLKVGREAYYESEVGNLSGELGSKRAKDNPFLSPRIGLPKYELGSELQSRLAVRMETSSRALQEDLARHEAVLTAQGETASALHAQSVRNLAQTADHFRQDAEDIVEHGFKAIDHQTGLALKAAQIGEHPAEAWQRIGEGVNRLEAGFMAAAERQYAAGYRIAGNTPLNTTPIITSARDLLSTVPEGFEGQLPGVLKQLREIGGSAQEPAGPVTLEQAHRLRTLLRAKIDWLKPNADAIDHVRKEAERAVNSWLHDPSQPPLVQAGVAQMDKADAYYRKIAPRFEQKVISTVIAKMKTGFWSDAPKLANLLFEPGETLQRENAQRLLGPRMWQAVHAADVRNIINSSKILDTEDIDVKSLFAKVQKRFSEGAWKDSDFAPEVSRLLRQANNLTTKPGSIPIHSMPGDSVDTLIRRGNSYLKEMDRFAKIDPLGTLKTEMAKLDAIKKAVPQKVQESEPLARPLGIDPSKPEPTVGAITAAENILNTPDLIVAAMRTYGLDSPEFTFLRDVKTQQIFENGRIDDIFKMDPEVRRLLFPGDTLDKAVDIADTMKFLMGDGGDFGASLAAQSRVLNPVAEIRHISPSVATALARIPIVGTYLARVLLGAYYKGATNFVTGERFLGFLMNGVPEDPVERSAVKKAFDAMTSPARRATRRQEAAQAGHFGAGVGAAGANQSTSHKNRVGGGYIPPRRPGDAALEAVH